MSEQAKSRAISRRRFLKYAGGVGASLALGSVGRAAVDSRWIRVTETTVRMNALGPGLAGLRIAHLTDLHAGPSMQADRVAEIVARTNSLRPNLVALTGDIAHAEASHWAARELASLAAPLGCYAAPGNHDDPHRLAAALAGTHIHLLRNQWRTIEQDNDRLCVAGVEDLWRGRPDPVTALAGVDEAIPRLLLCHNPDFAESMPSDPRVDLMLSGHSHGGQIRLPGLNPAERVLKYPRYTHGLVQGPQCPVYISAGLGTTGPPLRFACRPEIAVITLQQL